MLASPTAQLDLADLLDTGYARVPCSSIDELRHVAGLLGAIETHEILTARKSRGPGNNSLSGRHGLAPLPPHTDGATNAVPPRWLAMRCAEGSDAGTLLYDVQPVISQPEHAEALRRPWVVTPGGGRAPFYAPVLQDTGYGRWVRLNAACMSPTASSHGDALLRLLQGPCVEHRWRPDQALLFSNWRFLHARAAVPPAEHRQLERITVR